MKPAGLFLCVVGAWVLCQVFGGQALERLGVLSGDGGMSAGDAAKGLAGDAAKFAGDEAVAVANPGAWLGGKVADLVTK